MDSVKLIFSISPPSMSLPNHPSVLLIDEIALSSAMKGGRKTQNGPQIIQYGCSLLEALVNSLMRIIL